MPWRIGRPRMALTRSGSSDEDWDGVLQSAGVREDFDSVHSKLTSADAIATAASAIIDNLMMPLRPKPSALA